MHKTPRLFVKNEPLLFFTKVLQKSTCYQSVNYKDFCRFADLQTFSEKDYIGSPPINCVCIYLYLYIIYIFYK